MKGEESVFNSVTTRLKGRMLEAFSFLVATAWAEAFDAIFFQIVGETDSVSRKLGYAIVFTLAAAIAAAYLDIDT